MKLNEFIKPDEEDRYWEKPVVDDLWAIDKLILSKKGQELEKRLSEIQIKKIRNVLLKFNEMDINGFKKILYEMVDDKNKEKFDEINR